MRYYAVIDTNVLVSAMLKIQSIALFYDGKYVTNEQMNDKRFLKMISN